MSGTVRPGPTGFEDLYDRHWKYVWRLCLTMMKNEADAEDCAEDVFVKVLTGDFAFNDETHEKKWLAVTAMNLCKDRLRAASIRAASDIDEEPDIAAPEENGGDILEAVQALPEKYRHVVWLFYYEGYQADEIAQMLDRPPSTVRNQLRDARERLKKVLGDDGYGD